MERDFGEPQLIGARHCKTGMGSGVPVWRSSVGHNQRDVDGGVSGSVFHVLYAIG
jgi:hypothetical protein